MGGKVMLKSLQRFGILASVTVPMHIVQASTAVADPGTFESNVQGTPGVIGKNSASGVGVWGEADPGRGVVGVSNTGAGIWGDTDTGRAVVGVVRGQGDAVWGETKAGRGVVGVSDGDGAGVWGTTKTGRGVVGISEGN